MKRAEVVHIHAARMVRQIERLELNDDAAKIAPAIAALAERHQCSPLTVARIALAHVGAA